MQKSGPLVTVRLAGTSSGEEYAGSWTPIHHTRGGQNLHQNAASSSEGGAAG